MAGRPGWKTRQASISVEKVRNHKMKGTGFVVSSLKVPAVDLAACPSFKNIDKSVA